MTLGTAKEAAMQYALQVLADPEWVAEFNKEYYEIASRFTSLGRTLQIPQFLSQPEVAIEKPSRVLESSTKLIPQEKVSTKKSILEDNLLNAITSNPEKWWTRSELANHIGVMPNEQVTTALLNLLACGQIKKEGKTIACRWTSLGNQIPYPVTANPLTFKEAKSPAKDEVRTTLLKIFEEHPYRPYKKSHLMELGQINPSRDQIVSAVLKSLTYDRILIKDGYYYKLSNVTKGENK